MQSDFDSVDLLEAGRLNELKLSRNSIGAHCGSPGAGRQLPPVGGLPEQNRSGSIWSSNRQLRRIEVAAMLAVPYIIAALAVLIAPLIGILIFLLLGAN